jgi:hypothetical protein
MEIVVPTTVKYSDAWIPFIACFNKFWQDNPYPINFITDFEDENAIEDRMITIGKDMGWCANFNEGLKRIDSEFILMLQEDFWLNAPVDHAYVCKALKMMLDDDSIGCFRLYPCPGPDIELGPDFGRIDTNAKYRVSCQSAIWKKSHLQDILSRFNTPREFEIDGTNYVNNNCNNFKYYAVKRTDPNTWPIQYYCSAIARGQWNPDAVNFVKSLNIPIDTSRRPFLQ